MSCLELTLVRLELSSNLLVPQAFPCQVFVCFLIHRIIFGSDERANAVNEG